MLKFEIQNDTMSEIELQKVHNYPTYPRYSMKTIAFINIENGSMGATQRTCFYIKQFESFYYDSFEVQPDKFLPEKLLKPVTYYIKKFKLSILVYAEHFISTYSIT